MRELEGYEDEGLGRDVRLTVRPVGRNESVPSCYELDYGPHSVFNSDAIWFQSYAPDEAKYASGWTDEALLMILEDRFLARCGKGVSDDDLVDEDCLILGKVKDALLYLRNRTKRIAEGTTFRDYYQSNKGKASDQQRQT